MCEIDLKMIVRKYMFFSSKDSSGQIGCTFDNLAKKFSPKGLNFFVQRPKLMKSMIFQKIYIFPQKIPQGHVECCIDNPAEINHKFI